MSTVLSLIACQKCGSRPSMNYDAELSAYAINCSNSDCYNDTHWQNSMTKAIELWNQNPCPVDIRGGQGDEKDDEEMMQ